MPRVTKPILPLNFEKIQFNNDSILGVAAYIATEKPSFSRSELADILTNNGYSPDFIPEERGVTIFKKAGKKATNKSLRSVKTEGASVYLQIDDQVVEEMASGYKRKDVVGETFFKYDKSGDFDCSTASLKNKIEAEIPHVTDELTTQHLYRTITNILSVEFDGALSINNNLWFLPSRPGIQDNVDKLLLLHEDLKSCVNFLTFPVTDNPKNRKSYWEMITREIGKRVENINKKKEELDQESSKTKIKSLIVALKNEQVFLASYADLLKEKSSFLQNTMDEINEKIREKFNLEEGNDIFKEIAEAEEKAKEELEGFKVEEKEDIDCEEIEEELQKITPVKEKVTKKGEKSGGDKGKESGSVKTVKAEKKPECVADDSEGDDGEDETEALFASFLLGEDDDE